MGLMRSILPYFGGKANLKKIIIDLIPDHTQYVEPFFGGGAVFFAKQPSKSEVINDLNGHITNFYRVVQTKFDELAIMVKGTAHSEADFIKAKEILNSNSGTDVELAWSIWCTHVLSFSNCGKNKGFSFNNTGGEAKRTKNRRYFFIEKYADRLSKAEIFSRDAVQLIKLKDTPETFFYLDPPYLVSSSKQAYSLQYTENDFKTLLDTISAIKGKFLLSSYQHPLLDEYRNTNNLRSKDIKMAIGVCGKHAANKFKTECLTWNYELNDTLFNYNDLYLRH